MARPRDTNSAGASGDDGGSGAISDRDFTLLLISLYKDATILWDIKARDYKDKNKKNMALTNMVDILKRYKSNFSIEELKKKINLLRTNFNREHTKYKNSIKSGMGASEVYSPKLFYYNDLMFIADGTEISPTIGSEGSQVSSPSYHVTLLCTTQYSSIYFAMELLLLY